MENLIAVSLVYGGLLVGIAGSRLCGSMRGYREHTCVYDRPIIVSQVRRVLAGDLSGKRVDSANVVAGNQETRREWPGMMLLP